MRNPDLLEKFVHFNEIRSLLDRIVLLQETEKFLSLAVLSEFNGEGKSFFTAVIARAYTDKLKQKVLVVDTSTPFPGTGSNLLQSWVEDHPSVDFLSLREWSGGASTSANEYQLKALLNQIRGNYGLILVDTSSLARKNRSNMDPVVIARQCDAALLVSSNAEIAQDISQTNRRRLEGSGIRLLGLVFNHGDRPLPVEGSQAYGKQ